MRAKFSAKASDICETNSSSSGSHWFRSSSIRSKLSFSITSNSVNLALFFSILLALASYLPSRIRFVRRATAGRRFLDSTADLDLFALRAMANQPLSRLARISDDPVADWQAGDREVIDRLADLELRACGLKAPTRVRRAALAEADD